MEKTPPPYSVNEGTPAGYASGYDQHPPPKADFAPPPQAGYPPPQAGYAPPPAGYAQPPVGYAPPPAGGYAPHPQGYYQPPPQGQPMQQTSNNVVVVNSGQPASNTVIIEKIRSEVFLNVLELLSRSRPKYPFFPVVERRGVNHCLHCCISIFFFPWIIVWICLCICD